MVAASLLLLMTLPQPGIVVEQVDVVEINHYYSESCDDTFPLTHKYCFSQVLFWRWNEREGRHEVHDWRMAKQPGIVPQYNWHRRRYQCWFDDGGTVRVVESVAMRETHTGYDPEIEDRLHLPKESRILLRKPK